MEKSNIPVVDEVNDQQFIEMVSVSLDKFFIGTKAMLVEKRLMGEWQHTEADVFRIDDAVVGEFLPSKVIVNKGNIYLMYYINDTLPAAVRPFMDDVCYAWTIDWVPGAKIRYPALSRVFIDQVSVNRETKILFIANSATYESLLSVPERKIALEGDLAVYASNRKHRWA